MFIFKNVYVHIICKIFQISSLINQSVISTSNFKLTLEKEKIETKSMNGQNQSINQQYRGNSWKSNEISSTQNSDINSARIINGNSSGIIQESQSRQDLTMIEKDNDNDDDDSLGRIDTRNKSVYFSAQFPSEYHLSTLECTITPKSLENHSSINEAVLVEDASSTILNLPSPETGITATDMTAEMPSTLRGAVSIIELDSVLVAIDNPAIEDTIESMHDNELILQSETATNASSEVDLKTEYSITKLKSSDTVSLLDTDTVPSMEAYSTSDCMLLKKHLSDNYGNSDSEFTITEKKLDEMITAEV